MSSPLPDPCVGATESGFAPCRLRPVSTDNQDLSLQINALPQHGIPKTAGFTDKLSGTKTERPGLTKCLETLRATTFSSCGDSIGLGDACDT